MKGPPVDCPAGGPSCVVLTHLATSYRMRSANRKSTPFGVPRPVVSS